MDELKYYSSNFSFKSILSSFSYWPRLFKLLWEINKFYFFLIIGCSLLQGLIPAFVIIATQEFINSIVSSQNSGAFSDVFFSFGLLAGATILNELVSVLRGYVERLYESLIGYRLNETIMSKSNDLPLESFENADVQDKLKRAQSEASYRPYQIFSQILSLISQAVTLFSVAAILIIWKWWVACLLIVFPLVSFISFLKLGQEEFDIHFRRAPKTRESWYLSFLLTKDNSFKEVKLFKLGSYLIDQYKRIFSGFFEEDKEIAKKRSFMSIRFQFLNELVSAIIIFMIAFAAFNQEIMIGNLVGMIQAVTMTQGNSQGVVQGVLSLCQNSLYMKQLFAFLDLEVVKEEDDSNAEELGEIQSLEFRNVSFVYPNTSNLALKDVNFSLKKGETVAVVGKNGSGKSTMVKVLTQLYSSYEGEVLINNQDVSNYSKSAIRQRIGAVFQDFVHYEMSARNNIGFGNLQKIKDDESILNAAERSGVLPLINKLNKGIDSQLGRWFEDGQQLSGGQWQRIAIARAFMREADVYILDEPSSFLDPEAEADIFSRFQDLVKDKIGLFISHRFSSVKFADKIIVFDNGEIIEMGSHEELISLNGLYKDLYDTQVNALVRDEVQLQGV